MKNTKILLVLLLLAALTLCSCHTPSPDPVETTPPPADTTPAETTPALTTPVATTPGETTPIPDIPDGPEVLIGKITSPDDVSLEGIKVDVYRFDRPQVNADVDPFPPTNYTKNYKPYTDFSIYYPQQVYLYSVYTDKNGEFSIEVPDEAYNYYIKFDKYSLPKQYGIWHSSIIPYGTIAIHMPSIQTDNTFALEKVESVNVEAEFDAQSIKFKAVPRSNEHALYFANCNIIRGRFDDNFIDAMINGGTTVYTAEIKCGDIEAQASYTLNFAEQLYYWEWRVEYLYYNNHIDKAQFDEIFSTREPTKFGSYY